MTFTFSELVCWLVAESFARDPDFETRDTIPSPAPTASTIPAPPSQQELQLCR